MVTQDTPRVIEACLSINGRDPSNQRVHALAACWPKRKSLEQSGDDEDCRAACHVASRRRSGYGSQRIAPFCLVAMSSRASARHDDLRCTTAPLGMEALPSDSRGKNVAADPSSFSKLEARFAGRCLTCIRFTLMPNSVCLWFFGPGSRRLESWLQS